MTMYGVVPVYIHVFIISALKVIGQLHDQFALAQDIMPPVTSGWQAGWAPASV
jgi:hypothetical protein